LGNLRVEQSRGEILRRWTGSPDDEEGGRNGFVSEGD
jgi:hypothetical protein